MITSIYGTWYSIYSVFVFVQSCKTRFSNWTKFLSEILLNIRSTKVFEKLTNFRQPNAILTSTQYSLASVDLSIDMYQRNRLCHVHLLIFYMLHYIIRIPILPILLHLWPSIFPSMTVFYKKLCLGVWPTQLVLYFRIFTSLYFNHHLPYFKPPHY